MKSLFNVDEWSIVQSKFEPEKQLMISFSIGNGILLQLKRQTLKEHTQGSLCKVHILVVFIIQIRPRLDGGKMVTLNILC